MRFAVAVATIAVLVSSRAHADRDLFVGIGVLSSVSTGTHSMAGVGGELTLTNLDSDFVGWGSYVQVEAGEDLSAKTSHLGDLRRFATGLMYVHQVFGVEAGGLYRMAPGLAGTAGLQLGLFTTLGFGSVELRAGLAPSSTVDGARRYGSDIGVAFAAKLPVQIRGNAVSIKSIRIVPCIWRCR
jgi:hypothetical protein